MLRDKRRLAGPIHEQGHCITTNVARDGWSRIPSEVIDQFGLVLPGRSGGKLQLAGSVLRDTSPA